MAASAHSIGVYRPLNLGGFFPLNAPETTPIYSVSHLLQVSQHCTGTRSLASFFIFCRRDPRESEKIVTTLTNDETVKAKPAPL